MSDLGRAKSEFPAWIWPSCVVKVASVACDVRQMESSVGKRPAGGLVSSVSICSVSAGMATPAHATPSAACSASSATKVQST